MNHIKQIIYEPDYVLQKALNFLLITPDHLRTISEDARARRRKAVVFLAMKRYCGMGPTAIAKHLGLLQSGVQKIIADFKNQNVDELTELSKIIESNQG